MVYESERLIVVPRLGIGLESVDTGITEKKGNSEDVASHNIETIHLSFGVSLMMQVFRRSYFGAGVNYHYCSYHLNKNHLTRFENNLISAEVFWRF